MENSERLFSNAQLLSAKALSAKSARLRHKYSAQAFEIYRTLAKRGHAEAQFEMGQNYEDTGFKGENYSKAFHWYKLAAKNGHAEACNCIGFYIEHGLIGRASILKAIKWYERGAKLGSKTAKRNYRLSLKQISGLDRKKA